jgi:hypothetical protein
MAKLLGVPATQFEIMYPEKALEMKRSVLEYIKHLRHAHINNSQHAGDEVIRGLNRNSVLIDESGFPCAPRPLSWEKVTKTELEPIYRLYMTKHYREYHTLSCADNMIF